MNRSLVFDLAAGTFKDSKSPAFWNARNNDPPLLLARQGFDIR